MFKSYAFTLCGVFITQQKASTPLSAKRYLCDICAFLNSLCNWESFRFCVFACVWCGVHVCACVCVCVFLLYFVILMLFRQLPYRKFHNKIFATNWSQIWLFFEDLIKYILSSNNCNTICKKGNKKYKKSIVGSTFIHENPPIL